MACSVRRLTIGAVCAVFTLLTLGCGGSSEEAAPAEAAHTDAASESHGAPDTHGQPAKGNDTQGHWAYTGASGQRYWAQMSEVNLKCVDGSAQSPINIAQTIAGPLSEITYDYTLAPIKVKNSGHSIQVDYLPASGFSGGKIVLEGKEYKLLQFHFHRPSEHTLNGRQFPMEVHLVHQADDQNLAVVGILMDFGADSRVLDAIWTVMPEKEGAAVVADRPFNAISLLPSSLATYRYAGSLTTPPCSEGVSWLLMKTPISASQAQVQQFRKLFEFNSRYTQPLNGRDVYEDTAQP